MEFPFQEIESKIGYVFQNRALLKQAFTHSTYANAHGGGDNERMEYLGDSVLQLIVTEWQYENQKKASEGELTRQRQKIVCEDALLKAVQALQIEEYLLVFGSGKNVGKKTVSSLFETVTAAIYLDGGYEAAKKFILSYGLPREKTEQKNYKGLLQEALQEQREDLPRYETKKTGKDDSPIFHTEAIAAGLRAEGSGRSKKEAEQQAAKVLLALFTRKK